MTAKFSNSQIDQYAKCPLSWHYEKHLGLRKRGVGAIEDHHRVFGRAIHKGLETLYSGGSLRESIDAFVAAYPHQLDPADLAKTQDTGIAALRGYVDRWADEDRHLRAIHVERLEQDHDDSNLITDLVYEDRRHPGSVYVMDHKTAGGSSKYLDDKYWSDFQWNAVVSRYISHIREQYGRCDGFTVNAISFGHRTKATSDRKTKERLEAGPWNRYGRQTFNRELGEIKLDRASDFAWSEQMEQSIAADRYPMNRRSCRWCSYQAICTRGQSWPFDEENILSEYYVVCGQPLVDRERCVLEQGHEPPCLSTHPVEPDLIIIEEEDQFEYTD